MGATMIYSIPGFHRPGASLCAPVGGTQAVGLYTSLMQLTHSP
jgi:hypothetical protein